eukprot:2183325-Rhodomonas_salina.8
MAVHTRMAFLFVDLTYAYGGTRMTFTPDSDAGTTLEDRCYLRYLPTRLLHDVRYCGVSICLSPYCAIAPF